MTLAWARIRIVATILSVPMTGLARDSVRPSGDCHVADACYSACVSTRDCVLEHDSRDCSRNVFPFGLIIHDPACEANKAVQNQINEIQKVSCEASKADEKSQCEGQKAACLSVAAACSSIRRKAGISRLKGAIILWVDDNPDNNIYQRQALVELGARLLLASDTHAALKQLQTHHVDVIISDFERADDPRGAYTLLSEVRKRTNPPRFIIFSGSATAAFAAEAKRKGAFGETNENPKLFDLVLEAVKKPRRR